MIHAMLPQGKFQMRHYIPPALVDTEHRQDAKGKQEL